MTVNELLAELAQRGVRLQAEGDKIRYLAPNEQAMDEALRTAVKGHRSALLKLLSSVQAAPGLPALTKAPEGVPVRCSPAQERFLFVAELDGSSNPYRLHAAFRIEGPLQQAHLRSAFLDVVRRHAILRARFERHGEGFALGTSDWVPALPLEEFEGGEEALLDRITGRPEPAFDLLNGPHLSATLYRLAPDLHLLYLAMHHVVSDGGSIAVFAQELAALYAWRAGLAGPPPEPPLQFRDFAHAEREQAARGQEQAQAFWQQELAGAPPLLNLPTDRPRPPVREGVAGSVPVLLDEGLLQRIRAMGAARQLSEFQIVTAAYWLMLHVYAGQQQIVIGTPWRHRERPGSEALIGPLLNVLPLHIRPAAGATLGELLDEVRERALAAITHGQLPFERIVSLLSPERSTAHTPIFQAMCAIESTPDQVLALAGLKIALMELPDQTARYDLALVLRPAAGGLRGLLKFDRALFDEDTAVRMARHFVRALELVLEAPATPLAQVQLMDGQERQRVLRDWNDTAKAYPLHRTLVDAFHDMAAEVPQRIAVEDAAGRSITYRELDRWGDAVAHRLAEAGVGLDDVVGVCHERSIEFVVAVLGVLKVGAAYLPISTRQPPDRRHWMLHDAGVKAVIGQAFGALPEIPVGDGPAEVELARPRLPGPRPQTGCYLIYTSGSTGLPKGVVVDHRAIANNLFWMNDEWPLCEADALLFKSDTGFDVSVKEIFWPLLAGARLVVAPPDASDPERLCELLQAHRITVVHMVPTMLDFFLRHESAAHADQLRIVMCGGEALTPALRSRFHQRFEAILLHLYGPTEAAIAVTGTAITRGHQQGQRLPLGRPMPNCALYVLDGNQRPVPIGVPGELCIAGTPLARGYLGRPDLTAGTFVAEPFSGEPGSRMYRTGDLARWRPDGQVDYLGRIDRQIKLGGVRMEPGEIEAALRAHPEVDDAVVAVSDSGGQPALVGYAASRVAGLSGADLQQHLRGRLPPTMVPARIHVLAGFPTNVNGKVDVPALLRADAAPQRGAAHPPQGEIEQAIAAIWCQVLALPAVDRDEDFFELGGHSLLVLQVQARLKEALGCKVALAKLFLHPTVESLAAHLAESNVERARLWIRKKLRIGNGSAS